ncbi:hypothetical protein AQUCO_02600235v1 [Aquilegia coerulea]|uniref:RRM domain-containing protein n=1 Tax=Aquilegia coerulea TaxID=218851 RepID=A0A2G5D7Z7_AQUCA|nr:hypothetical protein AQUCO_02600235v1 [Aquilegia coerulea]
MERLNIFLLSLGDHIQGTQPCISCHTGVPEKSVPAVDAVSDIVRDSPHKIFVGGISRALSSNMLMEIASSFGHLKASRFEVNADLKEPCAFLEKDQAITLKACAGWNGIKLGGQVLTAIQAVPNASVEHAKPLLSKPTKVLKLKTNDLSSLSGSEIEEALEDIRIECARFKLFGTVKSIHIVRCESSCAIADRTDEVTLQDLEGDSFTKRTETLEQDIDHASRENRSEDVRPTHDIPEEDMEKTEMSEECRLDSSLATDVPMCNLIAEANPQEAPSQEETSKDKFSCGDELNHDNDTSMNKSIKIEPELKHMEAKDGLQEASIQLNHTVSEESQISERNDSKQEKRGDEAFEQGCVLVEYVRSEASCMEAHCLHGRLMGIGQCW